MKYSEMEALSAEELAKKIVAEEDHLMQLKFAHAISPIENPIKIRATRRMVARLKTAQAKKLGN